MIQSHLAYQLADCAICRERWLRSIDATVSESQFTISLAPYKRKTEFPTPMPCDTNSLAPSLSSQLIHLPFEQDTIIEIVSPDWQPGVEATQLILLGAR